jgi:hypothetical protein
MFKIIISIPSTKIFYNCTTHSDSTHKTIWEKKEKRRKKTARLRVVILPFTIFKFCSQLWIIIWKAQTFTLLNVAQTKHTRPELYSILHTDTGPKSWLYTFKYNRTYEQATEMEHSIPQDKKLLQIYHACGWFFLFGFLGTPIQQKLIVTTNQKKMDKYPTSNPTNILSNIMRVLCEYLLFRGTSNIKHKTYSLKKEKKFIKSLN